MKNPIQTQLRRKQALGIACCYSANWLEATGEVFSKKRKPINGYLGPLRHLFHPQSLQKLVLCLLFSKPKAHFFFPMLI